MKQYSNIVFGILFFVINIQINIGFSQTAIPAWTGYNNLGTDQASKGTGFADPLLERSVQKVEVNSTGSFALSIPLMTVPGKGGLDYKVQLNYTPGIRVAQEASWVGLGWNLDLGSISRNVLGGPDWTINSQTLDINPSPNNVDIIPDDYNRDIYNLSCPAGGGKIVQLKLPNDFHYDLKLEEWRPWKISYDTAWHSFIVVTEDGTQYIFGMACPGASGVSGGDGNCLPLIPYNDPYYQWHLTAILSYNYKDAGGNPFDPCDSNDNQNLGSWIRIYYSYDGTDDYAKFFYYTTRNYQAGGVYPISLTAITYPSYIITPSHIAQFITEEEAHNPVSEILDDQWIPIIPQNPNNANLFSNHGRTDLGGEKKRRLKSIKLYRNDYNLSCNIQGTPGKPAGIPSTLTNPLKEITFEYKSDNDYQTSEYLEKRTMLKEIKINGEGVALPPYKFTYYDAGIPNNSWGGTCGINSQYKDYLNVYQIGRNGDRYKIGLWGWYNSKLTPSEWDNFATNYYNGDQNDGRMWNLKTIIYPSGGSNTFDYESNRFIIDFSYRGAQSQNHSFDINASAWGAGTRLKSQTLFNGYGVTSYDYLYWSDYSGGTMQYGRLYADPQEYCSAFIENWGEVNGVTQFGRCTNIPADNEWLTNQIGHSVVYGYVKETNDDKASIISHYSVAKLDEDLYPSKLPPSVGEVYNKTMKNRGQLISQSFYDENNVLVKCKSTTSREAVYSDLENIYFLSAKKVEDDNTETIYGNNGPDSSYNTIVYDPGNGLPSDIVENGTHETAIGYAYDQGTRMRDKNVLTPLRDCDVFDWSSGEFLSSTHTDYALYDPTWYYPDRINHRLDAKRFLYDDNGNIVTAIDENGIVNTTQWDKYSKPVAIAINSATTKNNFNYAIVHHYYSGFEDGTGWDGQLTAYDNARAHTGSYSGRIDAYGTQKVSSHSTTWTQCNLLAATKYHYSGWVYSNGPSVNINLFMMKEPYQTDNYVSVDNIATTVTNQWVFLEKDIIVPVDVTWLNFRLDNNGSGTVWFDDIRLRPSDTQMKTFTYDPKTMQVSSVSDENCIPIFFEYDGLQRPLRTKDYAGRTLSENCYSFSRDGGSDDFNPAMPNSTTTIQFVNGNLSPKNWSFEEVDQYNQPTGWWLSAETAIVTDGMTGTKAIKLTQHNNEFAANSQEIGILKAGKTYTASVWFKAASNVHGSIFFGDANEYNVAYDNAVSTSQYGNNGWQRLTVTHTMSHDDDMEVYIYANDNGSVIYDDVVVEEADHASQPKILTTYYDGFGRPIQMQNGIYSEADIVSALTYDNMGRVAYSYKPYVFNTGHKYDPHFQENACNYYIDSVYKVDPQLGDMYPYKSFEYFSDGKIKSMKPAGETWHSSHFKQYAYDINTNTDSTGYAVGALWKTTVTDEDTKKTVEFRDNFGNLVQTLMDPDGEKIRTKYQINGAGEITGVTNPKNQISSYRYDTRKLLLQKQTPDAGTTKFLYDKNGNLRFIQDANHSGAANDINVPITVITPTAQNRQFTLTKPGVITLSADVDYIDEDCLSYVKLKIKKNGVDLGSVSTFEWDGATVSLSLPAGVYIWEATPYGPYGRFYCSVNASMGNEFIYNKYDNLNRLIEEGEYVSNSASGNFTETNAEDQAFPQTSTLITKKYVYDAPSTAPLAAGQRNLKGRISYTEAYRLGGLQIRTYYSYDEMGRVEWMVHDGLGWYAKKLTFVYDMQGKIVKKGYVDYQTSANNMYCDYQYDQAGRMTRVRTCQDASMSSPVLEAAYQYFAFGKPKQMVLGSNLQTVDYSYNERNWLTKINDPDLVGSDKFAEHLHYFDDQNAVSSNPQYNGNVSWVSYNMPSAMYNDPRNIGFSTKLGFVYGYDGANRLTSAQFRWFGMDQIEQVTNWWPTPSYNERYKYDKVGNFDSLYRNLYNGTAANIGYTYQPGTNRLISATSGSYEYDAIGNQTCDTYRGIAFIQYDINNMPIAVYKTNGTSYAYCYDVNDKRVRKVGGGMDNYYVTGLEGETEVVIPAAYGRNYTYNIWGNGLLGQIRNTNGVFNRYYYLKDHLGNIRVTVNSAGTVVGYDDYSPYGLQLDGRSYTSSSDSRYKFIGVERDAETGLDHNGDRSYDSRLGRSTSIDPFAMKSPGLSPYSYAGNNPVIAIDANGDEIWLVDGQDSVEYTGSGGDYTTKNKKIWMMIHTLNGIYDNAAYHGLGKNVLSDLISAEGKYCYRQAKEGELGSGETGKFLPSLTLGKRGGDVIFNDITDIAHETLHADLHENWLDGPGSSAWEEVQAYAFEFIMRGGLTKNPFQFGIDDWSGAGSSYTAAMENYTKNGFSNSDLMNAVGSFLDGSVANNSGLFQPYAGLEKYLDHQMQVNFLKMKMGR